MADRESLETQQGELLQLIAAGEKHIRQVIAGISRSSRAGHQTRQAVAILQTLREAQRVHERDRDAVIKQLAQIEGSKAT